MKQRLLTTLTAALIALSAWANGTMIDGIYYELDSSTKTASVTYTGTGINKSYNPSSTAYTGSITIDAAVPFGGTIYTVTSIGDWAFRDCTGLTSITIPNSVTSIGDRAFGGCTGLTSITIPSSVTSIGNYAFWGCTGLPSIDIPNSVTSIGQDAFENCTGLTSIDIPNSVTSIGSFAFLGCEGLTSINVAAGNTTYDSRDNCQAIIETANNTLIAGCMNSTIPNSVTSIGNYTFYGCTGLTSITIPNSVTSIGICAFEGCTRLTSITIPKSVTSIGGVAFTGCTGLTDIYARRTNPEAYNCNPFEFFDVSTSTCTLHVPKGSKEAYKAIVPWNRFENFVEEDFASDLNGDGTINVGDVTTLVNMILGKTPLSDDADLNGSGSVNVGDVTTLVDKILGRE